MRIEDHKLAVESASHWHQDAPAAPPPCALLADLDALLSHLEANHITPGNVIDVCPACGKEHRWALIKELLLRALDVQPRRSSPLLEWADRSLDEVRALYGGNAGYRKMRGEAEAYFRKIGAKDVYTP